MDKKPFFPTWMNSFQNPYELIDESPTFLSIPSKSSFMSPGISNYIDIISFHYPKISFLDQSLRLNGKKMS